ncbi:MAG: helix-turn-helix transcriptional regulator [Oscillospiraceae bacterium]|nr:helix-turn-helix transcriptional regulator [Oscillospiraceae bacterium]
MLSLHNVVSHMSVGRPVRVSTQTVRDRDYSHFHDIIQLCFVLSGELRHIVNGKEYIQGPGTCAFLLPYMPHMLDSKISDDTPVIVYVWFHESFLRDRGADFYSYTDAAHFEGKKIPEVIDFGEDTDAAKALIRQMISEFDKNRAMSLDIMYEAILSLFRLACKTPQDKKASKLLRNNVEKIRASINYMQEHLAEKLDIDFLSDLAGMSRRSYTFHCREITGLSPNLMLTSIRLSKAVHLLWQDVLHDDIARSCGLYDHTNLARTFKKYLGATPTGFQRQRILDIHVPEQKSMSERYPWLAEE